MRGVENRGEGTTARSIGLVGGARAGRVSPGLALLAALVVCGGVTYYFLRTAAPDGGAPETHETAGIVVPEAGGPPGAAPTGMAGGEPLTEDRARATASDGSAAREAASGGADRRIHGSVSDDEGAALAGAALRWVPLGVFQLRRYSHDPRALGKDADPSTIAPGRVRDALARSVLTTSAENGSYELRVPLAGDPGVVVVSTPGYEMKIASADPGSLMKIASADPESLDAPSVSAAVEPSPAPDAGPATDSSAPDSSNDVEIHFRLGPAGAISGKVTDSDSGEAVPGMTVVAGMVQPDVSAMLSFVNMDAPGSVVRPDGTYLLAGLKPGEYRVLPRTGDSDYVALTTRQATKVDLEPGTDATDVNFEVTRGARIFGTITGPSDKPIEGAECKVMPTNLIAASMSGDVESITMSGDRSDHTDAGGFYEIRGVPRGERYRVIVEADDHASAQSDVIEPVEESLEVNLALTDGSSISGHVFAANGEPAPGATVSVIPNLQKIMAGNFEVSNDLKATADADGAFRFEHLAAGEYRLHPGELKAYELWANQQKGRVVEVDGMHDVTHIELIIPGVESGQIAGIVTDDEGRPLEEVSIQVMKPDDFVGVAAKKLETGADGRFLASGLEGATFRIGASKAGYASVQLDSVTMGNTGVEIILMRHGRVSGHVITLEGVSLVAGGKVKAQKIGGESFIESIRSMMPGVNTGEREVDLGPDGSFTVEAPAGVVELLATVPTFAPAVSESLNVSAGQELTGVEILVTSGAVILGRVTLGREAIQGALVTVTPAKKGDATAEMMSELMPQMFGKNRNQATTNAGGEFEVRHLAPGSYKVLAAHGDYAPSRPVSVSVARDQVREIVDLVLTVGGGIDGVVREGEAPKVGMMVQLMGAGAMKQAATAADGTFAFRGLNAGEYMINIMDLAAVQRGKMVNKTRPVTVQDEQITEIEVVFGVGFRVHGRITGLPPAPMRIVTLRRPGGPAPEDLDPTDIQGSVKASRYQAGMAMVAADGQYEIVDVEAGKYVIEVLRMPSNPTDLEAMKSMDRTPHYRKEIEVEQDDVELDIVVK